MNKKYIILISIIIIYIVIAVILGIIANGNKKYIVFFDGVNLKYDRKWSVIGDNLPDENYNIVVDGVKKSNGKLNFNSDIADEASIERNIFAYIGNINIKPYTKEDISDYSFVKNILDNNNIDIDLDDISSKYLYNIDVNGDDKNEIVYVIYNTNIESGDLFSIIIVRNGENYAIIDIKKFEYEFGSYFPCVYFIDVDNDGVMEIVLKKVYASNEGQKLSILKVNKEVKNYDVIFREV